MNDNAKKVVEVLKSGEYQQTTGQLRNGNLFCCLGVMCDQFAKDNADEGAHWRTDSDNGIESTFFVPSIHSALIDDASLPLQVREWMGLRTSTGEFTDDSGQITRLSDLNDSAKLTFKEIARIMEQEPKGLFV